MNNSILLGVLALTGIAYLLATIEVYNEAKKQGEPGFVYAFVSLFLTPVVPTLLLLLKKLNK